MNAALGAAKRLQSAGDDNDNSIFTRKVQGAHARLFAASCRHYLEAAEHNCNDTPARLPIFSGLSPQQRVHIVKEVMVGLLCENEPLPQKEEHLAASLGIWQTIKTELICEIDVERDTGDMDDILDTCPPEKGRNEYKPVRMTNEEWEESVRKYSVRAKIASRMKKDMAKKNFAVPTNDCADENKSNEPEPTKQSANECLREMHKQFLLLFEGGPPPTKSRKHLRPDVLSDTYYGFQWRITVDDAFQDHGDNTSTMRICLPLKELNFNWKSSNSEKWCKALELLMLDSGVLNFNLRGNRLWNLHVGVIGDAAFANPAHHPRIGMVMKTIRVWRRLYEDCWDASKLAIDGCCIHAVCATHFYTDAKHRKWQKEYLQCLKNTNVVLGDYQRRLDVHRSLENFDTGRLAYPMNEYTGFFCEHPNTVHSKGDIIHIFGWGDSIMKAGYEYENCNSSMECIRMIPSSSTPKTLQLKRCSGW